jgi:integrase/recombinase XerD
LLSCSACRSRHAPPPEIDAFIDALWLEDGLSKNTLAAYRRDLRCSRSGCASSARRALDATASPTCRLHGRAPATTKATSANRRLTVFKRYFRWALRERLITADPTLRCSPPSRPLRVPKTLTEAGRDLLATRPTWRRRWACATARCWS